MRSPRTAKDQRAPRQGLYLWRPAVEMASDLKIVGYTKIKEVNSEPNAKVKGKIQAFNLQCQKKKERKVYHWDNFFDLFLNICFVFLFCFLFCLSVLFCLFVFCFYSFTRHFYPKRLTNDEQTIHILFCFCQVVMFRASLLVIIIDIVLHINFNLIFYKVIYSIYYFNNNSTF